MSTRLVCLPCTVLALFCAASLAGAQEPGRGEQARERFDARFNAADANHDGKLSREEAKAGMPNIFKHFDEIDTAKRGAVSKEEIGEFLARKERERRGTQ
ncbi:hypothetical protein [Cupriavidus sp. IDO]|uniref:hypothetical protein n=1 Tax=Cupriavidus sp. IDO TaxID=1539142 RepID=UPI000578F9D4|nr:hypothetical protein [Cupriavidus sp. IDO]KWR92224.1 hypothetical protein RM96_00480 [Cupriavidus sp. IDO]